jgi:methyl-accepting chemotaxis protein
MKNYNLRTKLIGGFISITLLMLIGGFAGWNGIARTGEELKNVSEIHYQGVYSIGIMAKDKQTIQRLERSVLVPESFNNESERNRLLNLLEAAWDQAGKNVGTYEAQRHMVNPKDVLNDLKPAWDTWKKDHQAVIASIKEGKRDEVLTVVNGRGKDSSERLETILRNGSDMYLKNAEEAKKAGEKEAFRQQIAAAIFTVAGIILAAVFGFFFTRSITGPIKKIIKELTGACMQFAATSDQIASSSNHLAQRTSYQAQAAQEASLMMEDLNGVVKQYDDTITGLTKSIDSTSNTAITSFQLLTETNRLMKKIKQLSEDAEKTIKTINEIAFQTNLLSLTASVEAARAGESGSGFAIVAEEVKNLAQRSSEAVKNTSACIEQTLLSINKGREQVKESLSKFIAYGTVAQGITAYTATATEVTRKQTEGIEQMNASFGEISHMAQSNAAGAQEAASVAQEINAQAESMKEIIATFSSIV